MFKRQYIKIVTVATHNKGYLETLKEGCLRNNIELKILGFGEKWQGFVWKFKKMRDYVNTIQHNDIVIFVDGYDTLFLGDTKTLINRFKECQTNILVSKDHTPSNIFHRYALYKVFNKCQNQPINTGMYMGYAKSVKKLLDTLCSKYDCSDKDLDDQRIFTELCNSDDDFYNKNVKIDIDNRVFMNIMQTSVISPEVDYTNLLKQNKLRNSKGEEIMFVQGPGNADMDPIIETYGFKKKGARRSEKLYLINAIKTYSRYFFEELMFIIIMLYMAYNYYQ